MKQIYCATCGCLVAEILPKSRIMRGAAMICRDCWGDDAPVRHDEPCHPGEMPDFLKDLFRRSKC